MSNLGGALARLGDHPAARSILLQVIETAGSDEAEEYAKTYYYLTEAYLGENGVEAALPTAKRALALAQEHQSPEDLAVAWRVLGQTAAVLNAPIDIMIDDQTQPFDAVACFTKSDQIAKEAGMEGERARTLREWANYELQRGDRARGAAMWQEARDLFVRLTATFEADRMGDLPTASAD
jgi:tetratricopeptide (TPR) repeat protein